MNIFKARSEIKTLSFEKQSAFDVFYKDSMNNKFRPIALDFTLLIIWINSLVNIGGQFNSGNAWSSVHPLAYLYFTSIIFLALVNKLTRLRYQTPFMFYALVAIVMAFAYRDFVVEQGWLEPITGLYFFLAFIGYVTVSFKHTLIILLLNSLVLMACHITVYGAGVWGDKVLTLLSSVFVFNCTLSALASAVFVNWILKNLFAIQFLLNEKNEALTSTLKMLKSTEEQLIQQQKYQALNHMAKGLLHEIINPVNSSSQALSYAKSINQDEDIGEAIDEAMSQHKRISDIVTDLRRFAQPEPSKHLETQSLDELITKALKFCSRELKKSNVEVKLFVGDQQFIACQPSAMIQVFVNVILNACDALKHKADTLHRTIDISTQEHSDSLSVCIKDNGAGISESALKQIMDPFVSNNRSSENMGLGLSICQTIMRHHQGSMKISSELNAWTEVALIFPAQINVTQAKMIKKNNDQIPSKQIHAFDDIYEQDKNLVIEHPSQKN